MSGREAGWIDGELRLRERALEWREVEGEIVAIDVPADRVLAANPAASVLWVLLASGCRLDVLVDALVDRFGIDRKRAEDDAVSFLLLLRERGLLGEAGPPDQ